jgi:hypothetical protein
MDQLNVTRTTAKQKVPHYKASSMVQGSPRKTNGVVNATPVNNRLTFRVEERGTYWFQFWRFRRHETLSK